MIEYKNVQPPALLRNRRPHLQVLDGELVGVLRPKTRDQPGGLCIKGWNVHAFVNHKDRLRTPLIRKNGVFVEASWDEALRSRRKMGSQGGERPR
jgi:predicted molibdopterin-dependent oxidoreductase YjgC